MKTSGTDWGVLVGIAGAGLVPFVIAFLIGGILWGLGAGILTMLLVGGVVSEGQGKKTSP